MKVIIYGATDTGKSIYQEIKEDVEVVAFTDDDPKRWGDEVDGIAVISPETILKKNVDEIVVGVLTYQREVNDNLHRLGIDSSKINNRFVEIPSYARIESLKGVRKLVDEDNISGNVAELGVFRGEFAREINRIFPDRTLYLFDTFEGFSEDDTLIEMEKQFAGIDKKGYFSNTSVELVLSQMKYPEMCIFKKGFFPDTAIGLDDTFCFVNLDADLYAPTLAGLEYFYPRMETGGVIFVHDYFSKVFLGAKEAVKDYCKKMRINYVPIGDTLSVAIRK